MLGFAPTSAFSGSRLRLVTPSVCTTSSKPFYVTRSPRATLTIETIANKSYQLEEDEDSLSCTSAIYLNEDGNISMGKTDGPRPDKVDAAWSYNPEDGELMLEIERFFDSEARTPFSVKRILKGHLDESSNNLKGLPVFVGGMYKWPTDFSQNSEVGWWAMILAVDDLPEEDFNVVDSV